MINITSLRRSGIVIAILAVAIFFAFASSTSEVSASGDTITVQVTGTYGQTEARTMLDMVNDFRTGQYIDGNQTSVWARSQSGGIDTSSYTNLGELQYDYELEKVAMQRAMEIALSFEHQRPNDSSWSSLFPNGYSACGENIAAGYGSGGNQTARQAFEGWCETNYSYGGQGHRRNMLERGFNRIGVGHVAISWSGRLTEGTRPYNYSTTIHFWVQEFGYRADSYGLTQTSASDDQETRAIELMPSKVTQAGITTSKDSLSITYGDSYEFNDASTSIRYEDTFPDEFNLTWTDGATSKGPYLLPVEGGYSLSSNNQNIASVSGKTINAVNVGETSLTINPEMAGAQSATVNVKVEPASLKNATISVVDPTYTGAALTPSTTVTVNGKTLVKDRDYEASYSNNINAGNNTATVTITGKGNYKDSASKKFSILQKSVAELTISNINTVTYSGLEQTPPVILTHGSRTLQENTDYAATYSNNINAGTATATITGKGNYKGTVSKDFTISAKPLTDNMVTLNITSAEFNGETQKPTVTVKDGSRTLNEGVDYTLTNEGGTNAGTYTVSVEGKGNYSGTVSKDFTINAKALSDSMVTLSNTSLEFNGQNQKPSVTVRNGNKTLIEDTDYIVPSSGGTDAGTYQIEIQAKDGGNYSGSVVKEFTIVRRPLSDSMISGVEDRTYDGSYQTPGISVSDEGRNVQYEITDRGGGKDAGEYTVIIRGYGNYTGEARKTYSINPQSIGDISFPVATKTYSGEQLQPVFLESDITDANITKNDYYVEYNNNDGINVGTYTVTIKGKNNYCGSKSGTVKIVEKNIEDGDIAFEDIPQQILESDDVTPIPATKYNGKTLTTDDFTLSYEDNEVEGTGKVTVKGKGNFTGEKTLEFSIISRERADLLEFIANLQQDLVGETDADFRAAIGAALLAAKKIADNNDATPEELTNALTAAQEARSAAQTTLQQKKDAEAQAQAEEEAKTKAEQEARAKQKGSDGTPVGEGASAEYAEKAILAATSDEGPKGSKYAPLTLKSTAQTKTSVTLTWTKNSKAKKYVVYGNACGKKNKLKKLKTVTGKSCKITKISKTLKKGTYHKFMIVALNADNNVVSTSKVVHVATKGGKVGNHKSVTIKAKVNKSGKAIKSYKALTATKIKKGKAITITTTLKPVSKKLKVKKHRGVCYESSDVKIATVNAKGKIVAKKKGTCYIYAYAQNGVSKRIKVMVK